MSERQSYSKNGYVIALANQKGGVGKTTTALSLGIGLANQGKKVLLIDNDPQGSLTLSLGINFPDELNYTISDILKNIMTETPINLSEGIIHHKEGVDLMPSNIELSGVEIEMIQSKNRNTILKSYINQIKEKYNYIIVDCPPALSTLTLNALTSADSVIIPTQSHYLSAKGLEQLLQTIGKTKKVLNPKLRIDGILATMVNQRTNFSKDTINLLRGQYGEKIKVFKSEIPFSIRTVETSAEGISIYSYEKNNKVSKAYEDFTKEVLDIENWRSKNRTQSVR